MFAVWQDMNKALIEIPSLTTAENPFSFSQGSRPFCIQKKLHKSSSINLWPEKKRVVLLYNNFCQYEAQEDKEEKEEEEEGGDDRSTHFPNVQHMQRGQPRQKKHVKLQKGRGGGEGTYNCHDRRRGWNLKIWTWGIRGDFLNQLSWSRWWGFSWKNTYWVLGSLTAFQGWTLAACTSSERGKLNKRKIHQALSLSLSLIVPETLKPMIQTALWKWEKKQPNPQTF